MRVLTTARLALEEQAATLDPRTGRPRRLKPPAPPVELPPSAAKRFEPPAPQTVLLELSELSPRTRIAHRLYECSKAQHEMGSILGECSKAQHEMDRLGGDCSTRAELGVSSSSGKEVAERKDVDVRGAATIVAEPPLT